MSSSILEELLTAAISLADRGLAPATGGNFSAREDCEHFLVTCSGVDKCELSKEDFLLCDLKGAPTSPDKAPSAETLIHAAVYSQDSAIMSVLHTHSVASTVLSMRADSEISFSGYEMQKSIAGNTTHETTLRLPIIANTQDMHHLHEDIVSRWETLRRVPGFILCGHGLYAWGKSISEAKRHIEGFEFLLQCELSRQMLGPR